MDDALTKKLLALFVLSLTAELPAQVSQRIATRLQQLARLAGEDGDTQLMDEAHSLATLVSAAG